MISPEKITIVFQGPVGPDLSHNIAITKKAMPGIKVVLSTWRDQEVAPDCGADVVVRSDMPPSLPPIKFLDRTPNNINRQIASSANGLAAVTTEYAIKLRADAYFENDNLLKTIANYFTEGLDNRIAVCSYYTLNPQMFERMPFHVSDWMQFGLTSEMKRLWGLDFMPVDVATYYDTHKHPRYFNYFERRFRLLFADEQYIWLNYAKSLGYTPPKLLVDRSEEVLDSCKKFFAERLIILEQDQMGLVLPKHKALGNSLFYKMSCYNHTDWLEICQQHNIQITISPAQAEAIKVRKARKIKWRFMFTLLTPVHWLFFDKWSAPLRRAIKKLMTIYNHGKAGSPSDAAR